MSTSNNNELDDKMSMRLDINGKLKEKFEYLKKYYETPTNTALLRQLINMKYEEIRKKEKK